MQCECPALVPGVSFREGNVPQIEMVGQALAFLTDIFLFNAIVKSYIFCCNPL
jgi:hypothetical protein